MMKNIQNYHSPKYDDDNYIPVAEGIYEHDGRYCTSLCFEQEPGCGEGTSPKEISQYPLEDVLEHYLVFVSDFYDDKNRKSEKHCFLEFASRRECDIRNLRTLIGKRVYNRKCIVGGKCYNELIVE